MKHILLFFQMFSHDKKIHFLIWRIKILTRPQDGPFLGVYVQCKAEGNPESWMCQASIKLELLTDNAEIVPKVCAFKQIYSRNTVVWGIDQWISFTDLFNPDNGFCIDNSIRIRATIEADAPEGILCETTVGVDCPSLLNLDAGSPCLNPIIYVLYNIKGLRKCILNKPVDPKNPVVTALRSIFADLEENRQTSGSRLRNALESTVTCCMTDARSTFRAVLAQLQSCQDLEPYIAGLFRGKRTSFVNCRHVRYEEKTTREFYDLRLSVAGNKTLLEAMRSLTRVAIEKNIDTGRHGLQEGITGSVIEQLPPVLCFSLDRYPSLEFTFPNEIDLTEFMAVEEKSRRHIYQLHSVYTLLESQHRVFVNPEASKYVWYTFNDQTVARCNPWMAIQDVSTVLFYFKFRC